VIDGERRIIGENLDSAAADHKSKEKNLRSLKAALKGEVCNQKAAGKKGDL